MFEIMFENLLTIIGKSINIVIRTCVREKNGGITLEKINLGGRGVQYTLQI